MDLTQILLGLLTVGGILLGYFIKLWMKGLKEQIKAHSELVGKELQGIKEELKGKASLGICRDIHTGVNELLHKHAESGNCGEVVMIRGTMKGGSHS